MCTNPLSRYLNRNSQKWKYYLDKMFITCCTGSCFQLQPVTKNVFNVTIFLFHWFISLIFLFHWLWNEEPVCMSTRCHYSGERSIFFLINFKLMDINGSSCIIYLQLFKYLPIHQSACHRMRPANERRRYNVTSPFIGRAHTQNDAC